MCDCGKCSHHFEAKIENKKVRYCYLCGAEKPEFRVESKHLAHMLPAFKKFNVHGTSHISIHICENCFLRVFDKEKMTREAPAKKSFESFVICYDRQEKKHICVDVKDMFNYHYDEITPACVEPRLKILVPNVPSMEVGLKYIEKYFKMGDKEKMSKEQLETNPFDSLHKALVFSPKDWALTSEDAWIYGIIVGWDNCKEFEKKFSWWTKEDTKRLEYMHSQFVKIAQENGAKLCKENKDKENDQRTD